MKTMLALSVLGVEVLQNPRVAACATMLGLRHDIRMALGVLAQEHWPKINEVFDEDFVGRMGGADALLDKAIAEVGWYNSNVLRHTLNALQRSVGSPETVWRDAT